MSNEVEKAKRALLGLCDYDMNSDGTLTRIEPNRNGDYVLPKGCKKVGKSAITLRSKKSKIVLGSENILFAKDFVTFNFSPEDGLQALLDLDLRKSRYNSIYSLMKGLPLKSESGRVNITGVEYILDEDLFTEQFLSICCADVGNEGLTVWTKENYFTGITRLLAITLGVTQITDKFKDIDFFRKVFATLMKFYNASDDMKKILQRTVDSFKTIDNLVYGGVVKV
jgi:hypothetical protein